MVRLLLFEPLNRKSYLVGLNGFSRYRDRYSEDIDKAGVNYLHQEEWYRGLPRLFNIRDGDFFYAEVMENRGEERDMLLESVGRSCGLRESRKQAANKVLNSPGKNVIFHKERNSTDD